MLRCRITFENGLSIQDLKKTGSSEPVGIRAKEAPDASDTTEPKKHWSQYLAETPFGLSTILKMSDSQLNAVHGVHASTIHVLSIEWLWIQINVFQERDALVVGLLVLDGALASILQSGERHTPRRAQHEKNLRIFHHAVSSESVCQKKNPRKQRSKFS